MPLGSRLVFAFAGNIGDSDANKMSASHRAAGHGEPWLTRFEVEELEKELLECGFNKVSFLAPGEARAQYYAGRRDLPPPKMIRLCEATV